MRMNWTRARDRHRMHRQGTEGANDDPPFISPLLPRRMRPAQPNKDELRRQAAVAFSNSASGDDVSARAYQRGITWSAMACAR